MSQKSVPNEVPGIVFLSGGQSNELATSHLNEMNKLDTSLPWNLSFSYGRALQQPCLASWKGEDKNILIHKMHFLKEVNLIRVRP